MNINSVNHIYQAVPPYQKNRELALIMAGEIIARERKANPDMPDQELWSKAAAEADEKCGMMWFGLTGVSMPETDALDRAVAMLYNDHNREKASELDIQKRIELVKKHVVSINNLELDGQPVTDFDTFYALADKVLVRWVCDAVHSQITLSAAERKNFMPGSVSPA